MKGSPLTPEELLLHLDRLGAIARRLERDPHHAEDLAQEAALAALIHRPLLRGSPTSWLASVLYRQKRFRDRTELRRRKRESASLDAGDSTDDARVTRGAEVRDLLSFALRDLAEPYRSTLIERYVEDRTPAEIAEHHGLSVRTVHTRITRGLRAVRERLGVVSGSPPRRKRALAMFAFRLRTGLRPYAVRRLASSVAAALVATVLLSVVALSIGDVGPADSARDPSTMAAADLMNAAIQVPVDRSVEREPVERHVTRSEVASEGGAALWSGRVEDSVGAPVPFALVRFEPDGGTPGRGAELGVDLRSEAGHTTRANLDGNFQLSLARGVRGRLVAEGDGFVPVVAELVSPERTSPYRLVVAPAKRLSGVVTDTSGGVGGASVRLRPPALVSADASRGEITWATVRPMTTTDEGGRFTIESGYALDGAELEVNAAGHRRSVVRIDGDLSRQTVWLQRSPQADTVIRGSVTDGAGRPIVGAVVAAGDIWTATDEEGRYVLEGSAEDLSATTTAVASGFLPSTAAVIDGVAQAIVLSDRPGSVSGRVIDSEGLPVEDAMVVVTDPTSFVRTKSSWFVEGLMHSPPVRTPYASTDSGGRFRIEGLAFREYTIRAFSSGTLSSTARASVYPASVYPAAAAPAQAYPAPAYPAPAYPAAAAPAPAYPAAEASPAGESSRVGVVLRMPKTPTTAVRGRVTDRQGRPRPGVSLYPRREILRVPFPDGVPARSFCGGEVVTTDRSGAFTLAPLDREGTELVLSGGGIFPVEVAIPKGDREFEVSVAGHAVLRVIPPELSASGVASMRVLDASGRVAQFHDTSDGDKLRVHARRVRSVSLTPGEPRFIGVPDDAVTLVLVVGDEVLATAPLTLQAGAVNEVGF